MRFCSVKTKPNPSTKASNCAGFAVPTHQEGGRCSLSVIRWALTSMVESNTRVDSISPSRDVIPRRAQMTSALEANSVALTSLSSRKAVCRFATHARIGGGAILPMQFSAQMKPSSTHSDWRSERESGFRLGRRPEKRFKRDDSYRF